MDPEILDLAILKLRKISAIEFEVGRTKEE